MRPRRKRKLTNYGEGHLHWIEESQLQKALMKSLREKTARQHTTEECVKSEEVPVSSKMPRLSVSVGMTPKNDLNLNCSVNVQNIGKVSPKAILQKTKVKESDDGKEKRNLRSRRTCNDSHAHAIMMQPWNSDTNTKETKSVSHSQKTCDSDEEAPSTDASMQHNLKTRAQRKFASNASPQGNIRRSSRFEAKLRRFDADKRANGCFDVKPSLISDKPVPETKDFLNYLCFRNTPLHFEMKTLPK